MYLTFIQLLVYANRLDTFDQRKHDHVHEHTELFQDSIFNTFSDSFFGIQNCMLEQIK